MTHSIWIFVRIFYDALPRRRKRKTEEEEVVEEEEGGEVNERKVQYAQSKYR